LIWKGETKNSGAGVPFTVTETPASVVGKGKLRAAWVVVARLLPKAATMDPGAAFGE
jgi:hypothetical protein